MNGDWWNLPLVAIYTFSLTFCQGGISIEPFMKKALTFTAILIIGGVLYLNYLAKKYDLKPLLKYEDIRMPIGLNCSTVRIGTFETEKFYIERTDSRQIHTNKLTGDKKEYIVNWKGNCEYVLISTMDETDILRVKITAVNSDNYGCYIISDKHAHNYANFASIKIL